MQRDPQPHISHSRRLYKCPTCANGKSVLWFSFFLRHDPPFSKTTFLFFAWHMFIFFKRFLVLYKYSSRGCVDRWSTRYDIWGDLFYLWSSSLPRKHFFTAAFFYVSSASRKKKKNTRGVTPKARHALRLGDADVVPRSGLSVG